jgi:integrase
MASQKNPRKWKGSWQARYRGPDGRQRSRSFARKVDAERFLATTEASKVRGDWVDPALGRTLLEDWARRWLESVRPGLKASTVASYDSLLRSRVLPALGKRRLADLRPSDVAAFLGELQVEGLSASRVRQAHIVLALVLKAAVADGLVARNVADGARLPRLERREAAYFDPETVESIAGAMEEPYDLLVRLLGTLGLRWGEAAALTRSSVDLLRRRLRVEASASEVGGRLVTGTTKAHAARSVPLSPSLVAALTGHLEQQVGPGPGALLFTSPEGGQLRHSAFYHRRWRPALGRLGLPMVGLHVLRHSAAARIIATGASPKAVQTVLGHASAAFSLTVYGHLFDADLDALGEALDGVCQVPVPARHFGSGTSTTPGPGS